MKRLNEETKPKPPVIRKAADLRSGTSAIKRKKVPDKKVFEITKGRKPKK